MTDNTCQDCGVGTVYMPKGRRHPSALCATCFPSHDNDLMEVVYPDGVYRVFSKDEVLAAEKLLMEMGPIKIRLDFDGVANLLDKDYLINSMCFISFVGKYSKTRFETREELKERLANGQGSFGILVFKRGGNALTSPGSKAWVNANIQRSDESIFIDDGEDHCKSTETQNILRCYHFSGGKINLLNLLDTVIPKNWYF